MTGQIDGTPEPTAENVQEWEREAIRAKLHEAVMARIWSARNGPDPEAAQSQIPFLYRLADLYGPQPSPHELRNRPH